jgi:hypothetical protein
MSNLTVGVALMLAGTLLVLVRSAAGRKAAALYRKLRIEVPEELYAKQFAFVGILMIIFGFLVSTGMVL